MIDFRTEQGADHNHLYDRRAAKARWSISIAGKSLEKDAR
jgi:hypothetical protein